MSRDNQIEEMVRIVCIQMRDYPKLTCKKCKANNRYTKVYCRIQFEMERLYNAGYRKASEVAREVIDDCIDILNTEYRKCDTNDVKIILAMVNAIAELKKKYTESEEN